MCLFQSYTYMNSNKQCTWFSGNGFPSKKANDACTLKIMQCDRDPPTDQHPPPPWINKQRQ